MNPGYAYLKFLVFLFSQALAPASPPAPTHHATVIVPAPAQTPQPHHVTVVTMGPASVINTVSTSRHNLDTIVQVGPRDLCVFIFVRLRLCRLFKNVLFLFFKMLFWF